MDINQRKSILAHLATKAEVGSIEIAAIQKEVEKIATALQTETQYDQIASQLELLSIIAYRTHQRAVEITHNLLNRLSNLDITYPDVSGFSPERQREYKNNSTLIIKGLKALENIRYHEPLAILDIFFEYSSHAEESIAKQARHGIEELSGYDLYIWPKLGWEPQEKILEKICSFDDNKKRRYFSGIITASKEMLSPTIEATQWNYQSVTFRSGAVPDVDGIKAIRKQTLEVLQSLYHLANSTEQKKAVISAMGAATRTPSRGDYSDGLLAMVIADTITVLEFMRSITSSEEDMQIMQKIEHDAYWLFYHKHSLDPTIGKTALEIRDLLAKNNEYQKFRVLIGFESIFHEWEKGKNLDTIEQEQKLRESEALMLACEINEDTYDEWKERIIRYASIKSNDLATFPYFGKFLECFGRSSPVLALRLLSEKVDQLQGFMIAILHGISETEQKEGAYQLITSWCGQGKYLFNLARFFEFSSEIDEDILTTILGTAQKNNDINTLIQIIGSVSAQYKEKSTHLIKKFFIPALETLTGHKDSRWILAFWFRKQRSDILAGMEIAEQQTILDNLLWLDEIDYQAEEILCEIAKQSPELVLQFFCKRLSKEKVDNNHRRYEAIPLSFHKLSEPLSQIPGRAVDAILEMYDDNYGLFIFQGARLLKNIFPEFPAPFKQELLRIIRTKEEKNLLFVMGILRNYEGEPTLHEVVKELVKELPEDSNLLSEVRVILENTGVVGGEYGFMEAYQRKIEEITPWLDSSDSKIKSFAENYISRLRQQIDAEKKRVDEDIILRNHQYGAGSDE